jgi:hypothetical protein
MPEEPVKNSVKGAIEALYKPVESIVKTLAGPAAEEIGLSFRDSVQAWRLKRQIRLFERVKTICDDAGIKPQSVKLSLLFDVVDKGSLEEDDDLQDLWANLLASAADPNRNVLVLTAFPDILRQISKDEALYLEDMFLRSRKSMPAEEFAQVMRTRLNTPRVIIAPMYQDNLRRLGLIVEMDEDDATNFPSIPRRMALGPFAKQSRQWELTDLGLAFIKACQGPNLENRFKA